MPSIEKCSAPANTLLHNYLSRGAYVDCYTTEIPRLVSFPDFIFAFYTTPLFKLERFILTWTVAKPSTDKQVQELADCKREIFAAWDVENRTDNEILMCDYQGLTRSWLAAKPIDNSKMRLYFGSAVVPRQKSKSGKSSLGLIFQALVGFHTIYSMLLLHSARSRLANYQMK